MIVFIVCLLLPNVRYNNRPYGQALELTDTVIDTIKFEFIISECLSLHESVYHATCTPLLSFHAQVFPVEHSLTSDRVWQLGARPLGNLRGAAC